MSEVELKSKIINKLAEISDINLLEELHCILNLENNSDFIELNKEQQEKIELAQKQYLNGKYLTNEQAEKDIKKCLE